MDIVEKEILFYQTPEGKVPFQEWRNTLDDPKARNVVRARMARLQAGNLGDCKSIDRGVFELRIFYGPGYRIYFGQVSLRILLILNAGDKGSQARDIHRAFTYWADYWRRS